MINSNIEMLMSSIDKSPKGIVKCLTLIDGGCGQHYEIINCYNGKWQTTKEIFIKKYLILETF